MFGSLVRSAVSPSGREIAVLRSDSELDQARVSALAARQARRIRAVASVTRTAMLEAAITAAYRELLVRSGGPAASDVAGMANIGNLGLAEILTHAAGELGS